MFTLNRKERDRQLRRSDILKAAEHLFALKGYHKATIRAIAREAQYASGTVYLHFKDKEALYFGLFEEKLKSLLSIIEEKTKQIKDARSKLKVFVQESLAFFEKSSDFFRIFVSDSDRLLLEAKLLKSTTTRQFQEYAEKLIKQAQEQKVISGDFDSKQVKDVFFAIQKTVVLNWFKEGKGGNKSLVDLSSVVLRYFLNGAADK